MMKSICWTDELQPLIYKLSTTPSKQIQRRKIMGLFSNITRRKSLNALSALDNSALSDLGLNRYDLFDAKRCAPNKIAGFLNQRRSERAHFWLR